MDHRLSILPSQCYSSADYMLESSHGNATRQPLQESSGNAQQGEVGRLVSSYARRAPRMKPRRPRNHYSMAPSILTPPIVPTQALGSSYASPMFSRPQEGHESYLSRQQSRRMVNPILLYPQFQEYRKRQDQKAADQNDTKDADPKWPRLLENAFLDALLIIPHVGRSKFVVKQKLHGRNMLIAEYLWHDYVQSLPPGVQPDVLARRDRKQVSSHIQVLKGIFKTHRCCHILLPQEITGKGKDKNDGVSLPSLNLKNHGVLVALSEGKFPHERADYDYFSRILELDAHIAIRPKRCWIFVGHKDVVVDEDGSGQVRATGETLTRQHYPHLRRNFEREKWPEEEKDLATTPLVHEYTKMFSQVESGTVRELSAHWKGRFPDFHHQLEAMIAANAREDIVTAETKCDIMHMHVTLEANTKGSFPAGSELNSAVEVNIEKAHLRSHSWKVKTKLVRPPELAYSDAKSTPQSVHEVTTEITIGYEHARECKAPRHRPGSDRPGIDPRHCVTPHCPVRRDYAMVPFPAEIWAQTLTNSAQYEAHPPVKAVKIIKKDDGKVKKRRNKMKEKTVHMILQSSNPTQMDLIPQIAMIQELWSCPPNSPQDQESGSQSNQPWTRRGVILWTFQTIHSIGRTGDENGALLTAAGGGTAWRFLTILDPMSEYHMKRSLAPNRVEDITNDPYRDSLAMANFAPAPRDMVMSPNPPYQEHLNASMSENLCAAWAPPVGIDPQAAYESRLLAREAASSASTPAAYPILGGYSGHGGLATPPPTASLSSSFATSFDSQTGPANYMAPPAGMDDASLSFNSTTTHHHHHPAGYSAVTYGEIHDQVPAWDGGGAAWPASAAGGYVPIPAPQQHDLHWERHHHHQQSEHWDPAEAAHHHQQQQHMWRPSPSLEHQHQHPHYEHGSPHDRDGWVDVGRPEEGEEEKVSQYGSSMGTRSCTATPHAVFKEEEEEDLRMEWQEVVGVPGVGVEVGVDEEGWDVLGHDECGDGRERGGEFEPGMGRVTG